jgi:hypothetical protein
MLIWGLSIWVYLSNVKVWGPLGRGEGGQLPPKKLFLYIFLFFFNVNLSEFWGPENGCTFVILRFGGPLPLGHLPPQNFF